MKNHKIAVITMALMGKAHAVTLNGFDVTTYGFIKASTMYSTKAVGSFNNVNMVAPTHAVPQGAPATESSRLSFQTQMTRIGLDLKKGDKVSAILEFDFVDFAKSSPTTQMVPRVRIVAVTYNSSVGKFVIGQDWDLYSPVNAYTFDYVGMYFLAGNTGFMRQQLQYLRDIGPWELGAAIGLGSANSSGADNEQELSKSPTYALRITRKLESGRAGISGIWSKLDYTKATTPVAGASTHESYGTNLFYEQTFENKTFGVRSEINYGQNLWNIGSLSVGRGDALKDVRELAGHFSLNYQVMENHFLFAGVGLAKADNRSEVISGNTASISKNSVARIGWEYRLEEDFSWISEVSRFETQTKLTDDSFRTNVTQTIETGVQLRF